MSLLSDSITVAGRYARSANLERDAAQLEPLDGYVVTARTLDVVERIVTAAAKGQAGGAWSLTGPYGSGKSSLALLLDATLGAQGNTRQAALALIDEVSHDVGDLTRQAHQRHGTHESGFHRALVTAQREPLSHTVLRARCGGVVWVVDSKLLYTADTRRSLPRVRSGQRAHYETRSAIPAKSMALQTIRAELAPRPRLWLRSLVASPRNPPYCWS